MRSTLLLAVVLVLPGIASAAEKKDACAGDAARFCPKVGPGPDLQRCLAEHTADLSTRCRGKLDRLSARSQRGGGGCDEDRAKLCAGVKAGSGEMAKCMRANEDKLSASCRAARLRSKACRADIAKLCGETEKGKGRINACLRSHQAELSKDCKAAMAGPS